LVFDTSIISQRFAPPGRAFAELLAQIPRNKLTKKMLRDMSHDAAL
jgi:hypothetical protein